MNNIKDMTKGRPSRLMLYFSMPLLLANVLQLFYVMADSAIVGRMLGVSAFAAVGASAGIYFLASSVVNSIAHGFGMVFAQRFGAKDAIGLSKAFVTAIYLMLMLSIVIGLIGVFGSEFLLRLLNTPSELLPGGAVYLSWLLGGMAITAIYQLIFSMLLALGDSKTVMRAIILVSVLNVAFALALVTPLEIAGPAIALLLAQLIGLAYCLYILRQTKVFANNSFRWDAIYAKELLRVGVPLGLKDSIIQLSGLVVQRYINNFGVEFIAGIAIAKRMYSLLFLAGGAFEAAAAAFSAQNFGANNLKRVRQGLKTGTWLMLTAAFITMPLTLIFGRFILGLMFDGDPYQINTVLDIGMRQLTVLTLALPIVYMLFLCKATLEGMGKSFISMLSGFLEAASRLAWVLLLTPSAGEWGILLADPIGWVAAAALLIAAYYVLRRREFK